jgi:hypothetical protein
VRKWEDMSEKNKLYSDRSYQSARIALIISTFALLMSVYSFWLDSQVLSWVIILMAVGSIIPVIFGFKDKENPYILWSSLAVAICAILLQYWVIALFIVVIFAILVTILSLLGVSF